MKFIISIIITYIILFFTYNFVFVPIPAYGFASNKKKIPTTSTFFIAMLFLVFDFCSDYYLYNM